jgi:hypothetical protein
MIRPWIAALLALLALAACTDRKQLVLSIDTTAGIPCDIDHIRVRATASHTSMFEQDVTGGQLPLTVTLSDETAQGNFTLDVIGIKAGNEVLSATGPVEFGKGDLSAAIMLDPTCTTTSPCSLPMLMARGAAPAVTAHSQCVGRYTAAVDPNPVFQDACTSVGDNVGHVLTDGTKRVEEMSMLAGVLAQSDFRFYGRAVRHVWANQYGYIAFGTNNPDSTNTLFPGPLDSGITMAAAAPPQQAAMGFWDMLTLNTNGVCYAVSGDPGRRRLRVTWKQVCPGATCTTDRLSLTFTLEEDDAQRVLFTYDKLLAGASERLRGGNATIGLVRQADGCPATRCSVATGLCDDGVPCGYTQISSNVAQPVLQSWIFTPVVDSP